MDALARVASLPHPVTFVITVPKDPTSNLLNDCIDIPGNCFMAHLCGICLYESILSEYGICTTKSTGLIIF